MKIRYFDTKREALDNRNIGDRIYYDAFKGKYYLIKTKRKKRTIWDYYLGK